MRILGDGSGYSMARGHARTPRSSFGVMLALASILPACSSEEASTDGSTNPNAPPSTTHQTVTTPADTSTVTAGPLGSASGLQSASVSSTVPPQMNTSSTAAMSGSSIAQTSTSASPDVSSGEISTSFAASESDPPNTHSSASMTTTEAPPPSNDLATVVPDVSWECGAPNGLPPPDLGDLVFEATLELGDTHEFGETQYGTRRLLDVSGGTFAGDRISGSFLTGGLDLELVLSNGALELEQITILRAEDGTLIYLRTCGFAPTGETVARFVPDFEAPNSSAHAWLNTGAFAGTRTVDEANNSIRIAIYDISNVTLPEVKVELADPAGVPNQPWECAKTTGSRGATVFTETVTLGQSLSVGASKRGTRNIIPITGGTVSGRLTGSVVPGGADYQLIGGTTTLDARYTLKADDGEYVLVRNCGPFGALIPQFEARKEGPYAFLNEGRYLSSDPGSAGGGVSITFYEVQ